MLSFDRISISEPTSSARNATRTPRLNSPNRRRPVAVCEKQSTTRTRQNVLIVERARYLRLASRPRAGSTKVVARSGRKLVRLVVAGVLASSRGKQPTVRPQFVSPHSPTLSVRVTVVANNVTNEAPLLSGRRRRPARSWSGAGGRRSPYCCRAGVRVRFCNPSKCYQGSRQHLERFGSEPAAEITSHELTEISAASAQRSTN